MAERIITAEYSGEMQQSYINYSMSVITARAVPDIRDGLKPVQRRVLYAMNELGLNADKPHRKSARIVGDAMGKYHSHGDSSIYDALVVLSQDFKKGMALVDGHGNFGSIEGDGAAAMRYTEARLKKFTQEVYLADLDKNVVDFVPNFDETEKEPEVLPVRIPNFLVNGSEGIAVGMTTSVPTHNLAEVIDAMKLYMHNSEVTTEELMQVMPGPDFPTGGIVTNQAELLSMYETGKGRVRIRGKAEIEYAKRKSDKDKIVITEIPYTMIGANVGKFLSDVAALVENRTLPDITDIMNQSSKEGIRIVIELKKGADAERTLQGLYKKTKLEDTFGVNMLAIVDGRPEVVGLKKILEHNLRFQVELNTRKYSTLLDKELAKQEIQEGLIRAVDCIDLIIEIIRGSKNLTMARNCLVFGETEPINFRSEASKEEASRLHFTVNQANAILELRLSKLIGLEILALQQDYKKTLANIKKYETLLGSRKAMLKQIEADLDDIRKKFALERRTLLSNQEAAVFEAAPVAVVPAVLLMNRFGYVKLMDQSLFDKNQETLAAENRLQVPCSSRSRVWFFNQSGEMHQLKTGDLGFAKVKDKGVPLDNLTNYDGSRENILFAMEESITTEPRLIFLTKGGMIKRVEAGEFQTIKKTIASTKLKEEDELLTILPDMEGEICLITDKHRVLKFAIEDIPVQKRIAAGVRAMKLEEGEQILEAILLAPKEKCAVKIGRKKVELSALKCKKRDGTPESFS